MKVISRLDVSYLTNKLGRSWEEAPAIFGRIKQLRRVRAVLRNLEKLDPKTTTTTTTTTTNDDDGDNDK